jgi:hypothetical protein
MYDISSSKLIGGEKTLNIEHWNIEVEVEVEVLS